MAFTTAQLSDIRYKLGYPDVYTYADPRLESAMTQVGNNVDTYNIVVNILALIDADLSALSTWALTLAGMAKADKGDAELFKGQAIADIQKIGRIHCGQLSQRFGVPKGNDIFDTGGYSGDWWKAQNSRPTLGGLGWGP